ncbi:helix-turn-helix domain-containing protein [Clostridium sp.]|uniref:helix-turn-helix domain-containing protein n=1 Tax=Clostridium sp. TaxID=1506 RepID=UPI00399636F2
MAFKKVNCKEELENVIKEDSKMMDYVNEFNREYELIQKLVSFRKEAGLTQKDVARKSGLTQQMISRIEKYDNSPTLSNFMKYVKAIGVDLVIQK